MKIRNSADLDAIRATAQESLHGPRTRIMVGMATCGIASGARAVYDTAKAELDNNGSDFDLVKTGCMGFCRREPLVDVYLPGQPHVVYQRMKPDRMSRLLEALKDGQIIREGVLGRMDSRELLIDGTREVFAEDLVNEEGLFKDLLAVDSVDFYAKQRKIALRNCGFINPASIEEYIARGGYSALAHALKSMQPEEIIEHVKASGLRGRGGGGFPAGKKWESCRNAEGEVKYVICNADEGDPGAYMDRSILEGDPHSVIEGMIIGAYAIGAHEGYIYVRNEYPLAVKMVSQACRDARHMGLLGEDILGSGFDFDIAVNRGAGAFVCGESTALMASLEGQIGEPRAKYIHTVEQGLWDRPSNLNNVETWNNVPVVLNRGSDWFRSMGTENSPGTKVFSLVGKVKNVGLAEVPMGVTLREMIYEVGGGIPGNRGFKAVQTGGPSGGFVPDTHLDLPIDFDALWEAGTMMGSGGMIVVDDHCCMVDVARFYIGFLREESCGKCLPCREGLRATEEILTRICSGQGEDDDLDKLEDLCEYMRDASLCGLGQTASNPVQTTMHYFRDEYLEHIRNKFCPAGVCRDLIQFVINKDTCKGCLVCQKACSHDAVTGEKGQPHEINPTLCIQCGACFDECPENAIEPRPRIAAEAATAA